MLVLNKELAVGAEAQKFRYENLNDTQKEIRNSVLKTMELLKDWERVITRNKELEEEVRSQRVEH